MKSPILAFLLLLTACNYANSQANASDNAADMNGTIQISFEQAEFAYQGQTYYLNDEHGVLSELLKQKRATGKAFFIRQDICLNGYIQTKAQNNHHGFGALGRYDKAVFVQKIC